MWISKTVLLACYGFGSYALDPVDTPSAIPTHWAAEIPREYEFVGPFPQEAREQHFLNPGHSLGVEVSFPLNYTSSFPSHLADGGLVYWQTSSAKPTLVNSEAAIHGAASSIHYSIAFPEIRWESIRATEGWAGLQHHALLHTKIRLIPPQPHATFFALRPTYLVLSASQCSYIAVFGPKEESLTPRWYTCNIYDHAGMPPIRVPLKPHLGSYLARRDSVGSILETIELDVLVSLDYEIRLFGDPKVSSNSTMPIIQADLLVEVEDGGEQTISEQVKNEILEPSVLQSNQLSLPDDSLGQHDHCIRVNHNALIFPHFIDGWAYGDAVGIEVSSRSQEYWSISHGSSFVDGLATHGIHLELLEHTRIAPSQTRLVTMRLTQNKPFTIPNASLTLELYLHSETHSHQGMQKIIVTIPIQNHVDLSQLSEDPKGFLMTYHSASGTPASAIVLPPPNKTYQITTRSRILLALHGAGVMHTHPFWISALPRPEYAWVLVVQGLTPWGLDWREASRADVCAALRALVLRLVGVWHEDDYCTTHDQLREIVLPDQPSVPVETIPVIAIGHSNGGQGSLHLASSFPDCIPALVPAAGYTSARLYVPTQVSRGSLFADAALQNIIRASLQGQDGDVIAGNLALSRVHLVHGGNDENVPVWHSRERLALIKTWNPNADVNMTEVSGKPHFWDTVFLDEPVSTTIKDLIASPYSSSIEDQTPFTLTVAWPSESGSMRGWRVREATVPGRLSQVRVNDKLIRTTNVHTLSIVLSKSKLNPGDIITLDHEQIKIPERSHVWFHRTESARWQITDPLTPYPSGPLSSILNSASPIALVIPVERTEHYETIALRIAHNLYTYLKLDCTVLRDSEVDANLLEGRSVVVIGAQYNKYGMAIRSSPLRVSSDGSISIGRERYSGTGVGALSLHNRHLYVDASDMSGYERILRAFPLRTGVPGPEWIIIGPESDTKGFGGVIGAGFWNRGGGLSESMSYFT
ncbi:hypothetical protein B0J17DRAFT_685121 [Rhizoctonia solani]|nr:hypothetical protein B0J17DRAFT_685121 [Rhizoctonia solani]